MSAKFSSHQFSFANLSKRFMFTGISVAAVSCTGVAYWRLQDLQRKEEERKLQSQLAFQAQATALSRDLILGVLKTDHSLSLVSALLLQACKHKEFRDELGTFLKFVFVESPRGSEALRKFFVDQCILDPWVRDHLLGLVKNLGAELLDDPKVWPGHDVGTLALLTECAFEALAADRFNEELWDAVVRSLWGVFFTMKSTDVGV